MMMTYIEANADVCTHSGYFRQGIVLMWIVTANIQVIVGLGLTIDMYRHANAGDVNCDS